jgi:hypothetical protein
MHAARMRNPPHANKKTHTNNQPLPQKTHNAPNQANTPLPSTKKPHLEEDGRRADLLAIGLVAVAQVAAVRQVERHDAVVRLQERGVDLVVMVVGCWFEVGLVYVVVLV